MRAILSASRITFVLLVAAKSLPAQQAIGRYETVECFPQIRNLANNAGLECGWLTLPEVRGRPDGPTVRLAVTRLRVKNPTSPQLPLFDGSVAGDTLCFSLNSPDGTRTIRFTGTLSGDTLSFVREVDAPAASVQGQGIFGVAGARMFTATRSR